ncbi:MAG: OmpA family protein [Pseudomonadota bacterium]
MIPRLKTALGAIAAIALLPACATSFEPDATYDAALAKIEAARASGMANDGKLSVAQTYLGEAGDAAADGKVAQYEEAVELAGVYADFAAVEGNLDTANASIASLSEELGTVTARAEQCDADLEATQAELETVKAEMADLEVAALGAALGASAIEDTDEGAKLVLQSVTFASGSARLTAETAKRLESLVGYLEDDDDRGAMIAGYTDSIGSDELNEDLSERRAEAVADLLEDAGIAPERLTIAGYGENNPIASNDSSAGRAQNRRVEITLTDKSQD